MSERALFRCIRGWFFSMLVSACGAFPASAPNASPGTASNARPTNEPIVPPNGGKVSAVSPPSTSVVDEPTYEEFVAKWMSRLERSSSNWGAFAGYRTESLPSPSGSLETMEAFFWFKAWCQRNGGTSDRIDGGEILERMGVPNGYMAETGRTVGYCHRDGRVQAALAIDPIRVPDGTALSLGHFSSESLKTVADRQRSPLEEDLLRARTNRMRSSSSSAPPSPPPPAEAETAPAAPAEAKKIRIENFSGLSGIAEYVYEHAPAELRQVLLKGEYAVFAKSLSFNTTARGHNYCWGTVGLTRPQPDDRNPRIPGLRSMGFFVADDGPRTEAQDTECRAEALRTAFKSLFSFTSERHLAKAARFEDGGGARKPEPANPKMASTFFSTSSGFEPDAYFLEQVPNDFRRAFDYRRLQLVGLATQTRLNDQLVCFGLVGASTSAPDDRNPRWPGNFSAIVREIPIQEANGPGDGDRCEGRALQSAPETYLTLPWDETGVLRNLNATREDGVISVKGVAHKNAAAPPPSESARHASPTPKVRTTSVTNLRYECFNGDCTRIFPNGKRERFQAPRCYDPFKQTWVWKPEGC